MCKYLIFVLVLGLGLVTSSFADPTKPSRFDPTPYPAQRVLYDFNFAQPEEGKIALKFVKNHLKAMKEFGDYENSHIVVVAHGNELHTLSRLNRAAYPEMYEQLKQLTDQGVSLRVCRNAAHSRGYQPDEFYDLITVIPAAVIEIAKWQNLGYSYMYPLPFPRITREKLLIEHPELK